MNVRAVAARVITGVLKDGESLNTILPRLLKEVSEKDQALLQEMSYGVLRWYPKLNVYLEQLLDRPFRAKDTDIHALLACGLYQLIYMRIPAHAAVSETVAATKQLKKSWAKGLVNAVLRRFQREVAQLDQQLSDSNPFSTAHPQWLLDQLSQAWPEGFLDIVQANNSRPPMTLRVNSHKITRDEYLKQLQAVELSAALTPYSHAGIQLQKPVDVGQLPGFQEGLVSVQDEAAQLAALLLELAPKQRVLDACCAPGGKTCHILEQVQADATVTALDIDAQRLHRVEENFTRLGLEAKLIAADGAKTEQWWDGELFDRILLDAPCSATGVIRRNPDIKLLRTPADIVKLAATQQKLLCALWPLLKPGGILLYATCSTLPAENDATVESFLNTHTDAVNHKIATEAGFATPLGRQLLPQVDGHDGFYYAKLQKQL